MKKCPFCAEEIQDAAVVCRYCGRDLPVAAAPPSRATFSPPPPASGFYGCPSCGKTVRAGDQGCRHCGAALRSGGAASVTPTAPAGHRKSSAAAGCLAIVGLVFFVGMCASLMNPSGPTPSASPTTPGTAVSAKPPTQRAEEVLELLSSRGYEEYSYHHVEGQVKNVSSESLENVAVVVTWYSKDDQFVTSDDMLIEYNPLLPGQTSPFKSLIRSNPAMSKYTVNFKKLFGASIATKDSRKR